MKFLYRYGLLCLMMSPGLSLAQTVEPVTREIVLKDHVFEPNEIKVPAGRTVKLMVRNLDATPEEFDSKDLRIEKIIAGKTDGIVTIKPQKPGRYEFEGEFHDKTAKGTLVVE